MFLADDIAISNYTVLPLNRNSNLEKQVLEYYSDPGTNQDHSTNGVDFIFKKVTKCLAN